MKRAFLSAARVLLPAAALLMLSTVGCEVPENAGTPEQATLHERLTEARWIDLTHPLNEETLVWPTSIPFEFDVVFEGMTDDDYYYAARNFSGPEHGGTHLDAPIHFAEDRWTAGQIPLERLVGPGALVDVSQQAAADPNYQVTADDLQVWEAEHGPIPPGAILLLHTRRAELWPDAEAYMGTDARGEEAVAELEFPGLHPDAAQWLVDERDVAAVGLDTPSLDHGPSSLFETHRILMEENIYGLENVANLGELPPAGATILAMPALLEDGTGGPVRIVAVVEAGGNRTP